MFFFLGCKLLVQFMIKKCDHCCSYFESYIEYDQYYQRKYAMISANNVLTDVRM